jgi:ABC-type uncharacterized transport system ATPase subunit
MESPTIGELAEATGLPQTAIEKEVAGEDDEEEGKQAILITLKHEQIVPVLQALLNRYRIVDMGIQEQSLEKVIQRLFEAGA